MSKQITIDPVTRIEGHAKITIQLGEDGLVEDARFHVTQVRGFEKFCEGRPFTEMPSLMARICGICPVSHLIASSKACDEILAVRIPKTAYNLRRIMNYGQIIQSHALSIFHLSSPDLLLGMDADPKQRNLVGVLEQFPEIARDGIRLRQIGQTIVETLGGKRIHPAWVVPGGVSEPLSVEKRDFILSLVPDAHRIVRRTLDLWKMRLENYREEIRTFANFPTLFMGLVNDRGCLEFSEGKIRIVDGSGKKVQDDTKPAKYEKIIGEAVEPWTYMKFPYFKPEGYPNGCYRVGPLARMNVIDRCGTPEADQEWVEFQDLERGVPLSSFYYHYARLIEMIFILERLQMILSDPNITSEHVRAFAKPNNFEGIGVAEAPRGTLIHHYHINEDGLITKVNLIIATGQNNLAMNRGILQAAKHFVREGQFTEGALNRVEAVIRAFDPCLSCSTHALGQMPLLIQLVGADGNVQDEVRREI